MIIDEAIKQCQQCSAEVYKIAREYERGFFKLRYASVGWPKEMVKDREDLVIANQKRAQALYEASSALYWIEYGIL